jgi:hypothetical protein
MFKTLASLPNAKLRLTILVLLTLNSLLYALIDSFISAIDSFAWLALLLSFELETAAAPLPFDENRLHQIRNGLIAVIVLVTFGYLFTGDILNLINSVLWLGLLALLEIEVRDPNKVVENRMKFVSASFVIFAGLIGMVVVWGWMGSWLDAFNAGLWIFAFALIEVDIFRFLRLR